MQRQVRLVFFVKKIQLFKSTSWKFKGSFARIFLPKFRNFLIQNLSNQILENAYGGAQPNISSKDIESLKFGLPSLAEQQEIVRQLDVMLAQVEQIKARLDAIPAILKNSVSRFWRMR